MRLVLLLSLLLPMVFAKKGCYLLGGAILSVDGQKCFFSVPSPVSFKAAETICAGYGSGSHLASVHNINDNYGALTVAVKNKPFWLGGYYSNSTWTWTDGTKFDYTNLTPEGSSNSTDEKCLLVGKNLQWTVMECGVSAHFVCEAESREAPLTPPPCHPGTNCYGKYLYHYHPEKRDWKSAEAECKMLYPDGHLASIHNAKIDEVVLNLVYGAAPYWIGGHLVDDDRVEWIDGSVGSYTNWHQEPYLIRKRNCLEGKLAYSGKWVNSPCTKSQPFLCQQPMI